MIVRSTHAAHLIPTATLPNTCRQKRPITVHSKCSCGLLRSSNLETRRHHPSVQVAAQGVVSAGQVKPRFAKQLGLSKDEDAAKEAETGSKEQPPQPRFAKQIGLVKENKHDEPDQHDKQVDAEQPGVEQPTVEEIAPEPSPSQSEKPTVEEIAPEPSPSQLEQGKSMHLYYRNAVNAWLLCLMQYVCCRRCGLGLKQGRIRGH